MQEIDYKLEGQNADRFRRNFADQPWIKVLICHFLRPSLPTMPQVARAFPLLVTCPVHHAIHHGFVKHLAGIPVSCPQYE